MISFCLKSPLLLIYYTQLLKRTGCYTSMMNIMGKWNLRRNIDQETLGKQVLAGQGSTVTTVRKHRAKDVSQEPCDKAFTLAR